MCTVSMIMDHYREKWEPYIYPLQPVPNTGQPFVWPAPTVSPISAEEIAEFRKLLERAREYDKRHNEPNCEMDEKRQAILAIARQLGVEITFL